MKKISKEMINEKIAVNNVFSFIVGYYVGNEYKKNGVYGASYTDVDGIYSINLSSIILKSSVSRLYEVVNSIVDLDDKSLSEFASLNGSIKVEDDLLHVDATTNFSYVVNKDDKEILNNIYKTKNISGIYSVVEGKVVEVSTCNREVEAKSSLIKE